MKKTHFFFKPGPIYIWRLTPTKSGRQSRIVNRELYINKDVGWQFVINDNDWKYRQTHGHTSQSHGGRKQKKIELIVIENANIFFCMLCLYISYFSDESIDKCLLSIGVTDQTRTYDKIFNNSAMLTTYYICNLTY